MKNFAKIIFLVVFALILTSHKTLASPVKGKDSDSASLKSNIAIFKMMTAPVAPPSPGKSLKKAGSVARTYNTHTTISVKPAPEG